MRKILAEFKEFALRGNVMNLAVGVIIGGAFQSIVKSLTDDIINPIMGLFLRTDFSGITIRLFRAEVRVGAFITNVINFVILAAVIFLLVKGMNKLASLGKKEEVAAPPTTKACPYCKSEIAISAVRCPHCTSELE